MAYAVLKGYEGKIYIGDAVTDPTGEWNTVGRVDAFTVEINQNLERFSQIGTRKTVIVDGQLTVSGTFSRAFIDSAMLAMATGILTSGGNLGNADQLPQNINIKATGINASTSVEREYYFILVGVTIDGWSVELTPTDIVMEDVDYIARSILFSDAENLTYDFGYDDSEAASGLYG
jgi:hypothetical protein